MLFFLPWGILNEPGGAFGGSLQQERRIAHRPGGGRWVMKRKGCIEKRGEARIICDHAGERDHPFAVPARKPRNARRRFALDGLRVEASLSRDDEIALRHRDFQVERLRHHFEP